MHISLFVLSIGYVLVSHCQQARYVHQFVHQYGWAWSTPLPHVYIHRQKHRSVSDLVNHYQLSFKCHSMDHLNAHKHVSAKPVPNVIRWCLISFLMGYDRNDRNDKGNGKSYMRKIGRGLQISCHSCHLCHWGEEKEDWLKTLACKGSCFWMGDSPYLWDDIA